MSLGPVPGCRQQGQSDGGGRIEHHESFARGKPGKLDAAETQNRGKQGRQQRRLDRAVVGGRSGQRAVEPTVEEDQADDKGGHQDPEE